jgi:hypothetical protein
MKQKNGVFYEKQASIGFFDYRNDACHFYRTGISGYQLPGNL